MHVLWYHVLEDGDNGEVLPVLQRHSVFQKELIGLVLPMFELSMVMRQTL